MSYRSNQGFGILWKGVVVVGVLLIAYVAWEVTLFTKDLSLVIEHIGIKPQE